MRGSLETKAVVLADGDNRVGLVYRCFADVR